MPPEQPYKPYWNFYKTEGGNSPVRNDIQGLSQDDRAAVAQAMKDVRERGVKDQARHLRNEIYEAYAYGPHNSYRLLFSQEGHFRHILLAVHIIEKRGQKAPRRAIDLAEERLGDWRRRLAQDKQINE